MTITLTGSSIPSTASALSVNLTVTDTTASGYLTTYPANQTRPTTSNINWAQGETIAASQVITLSQTGAVSIYNGSSGYADLIIDAYGYFTLASQTPSSGLYNAVNPTRLVDTRSGSGYQLSGQTLTPGATKSFSVDGQGPIPATGVSAVVLNVTATDTTSWGYLSVYPAGTTKPVTSSVNWSAPNTTIANRVIVGVGSNGQISIYNALGQTNVIVDVDGYFSNSGDEFFPIPPYRLCDTRSNNLTQVVTKRLLKTQV